MLVNWDSEKIIWDRLFSKEVLDVNPQETSLLVMEPYFNLPNICETYDQMVFEEWEFQSYFRSTREQSALTNWSTVSDQRSCRARPVRRSIQ